MKISQLAALWIVVVASGCKPIYAPPPSFDGGPPSRSDAGRSRDAAIADSGAGTTCIQNPQDGSRCCATPEQFAGVARACPTPFTVSCDGFTCATHSSCNPDTTCTCEPGYLTYHCTGAQRPCTESDPCFEPGSWFCERCPPGASVAQYPALDAPMMPLTGCAAPLVPCGTIHCYDPSTQVCCADVSLELDLCHLGDRCTPAGYCNDDGRAPP